MLFDAHRTHDKLPICRKLEPSKRIGGVVELLREKVLLVNCQDELPPTVIDEPDVIANGLQVEAVAEHTSVFCANIREEKLMMKFEEAARKAAPDAFAMSELFRTIQEL